MGSDAYFQGSSVERADADNFGSNWTGDELAYLRDQWRRMALAELAERLGRTERACESMYYHQLNRSTEQRWQPADGERAPWERADGIVGDHRPVNTIHQDEEKWWEADFYRPAI